jgi:hypothetical protein
MIVGLVSVRVPSVAVAVGDWDCVVGARHGQFTASKKNLLS